MDRLRSVREFYALMAELEQRLGGMRRLGDADCWRGLPHRGVYFFFDDNEPRRDSGTGPRIVRVGSHGLATGSASTLRMRLIQHRGSMGSGGGRHRGSIFRRLVGDALLCRRNQTLASWGRKHRTGTPPVSAAERAAERRLELDVSGYVRSLSFVCVDVGDHPGPGNRRGPIQRGIIALLSNFDREPIDPASPTWLGSVSSSESVRRSGLWNQRHVDEPWDPAVLGTLAEAVSST